MTDPNNPDKVFVVGVSGQGFGGIGVSVDGGNTWAAPAGTYLGAKQFWEVWVIDSNNIVAVGDNGRCVISNDGGLTFNLTASWPTPTGGNLGGGAYCVHFTTPLIGVVGFYQSSLETYAFRTNDGGVTWSAVNGGNDLNGVISVLAPVAIYMSNDQQEIVICCQNAILKSLDGGNTFTMVHDFLYREGLHMTWLPKYDATTMWATGQGDERLISTDGGNTWTVQNPTTLPPVALPRIFAAHYHSFTNGFYSRESNMMVTANAGLTGAVTDTMPGDDIIAAVWSQANPCYRLDACNGFAFLITDTDLSAYVGQTVQLQGGGCWTVSVAQNCTGVIPVTLVQAFADCQECLGTCYELIDCAGTLPNIITNTDLAAQVGSVIQIDGYDGVCWNVTQALTCQAPVAVNMTQSFQDCQTCLPHCFWLANCANNQETISVADDLSAYVGMVVQIEGDERCWYVRESTDPVICDCPIMLPGPIVRAFADCTQCPPPYVPEPTKPFVEPGFETRVCNTQDYLNAKCEFGDAMYNDVIRKRYGVRICCEEDVDKAWIKNEQADLAEMFDPTVCIPVIPSTDCCPPCNVTSSLSVFNPIQCPPPQNVTSQLIIPLPSCPPPENVTSQLFIG